MGDIAASMGAQFTLSMGDDLYDNHGVIDVDDPRFKETFEVNKKTGYNNCRYLSIATCMKHCICMRNKNGMALH